MVLRDYRGTIMKLPQGKNFKWNYLGLAFAIPCVGMLFVMLISRFEPFGKYSMLYSDMYHQYYPFFVEFRNSILNGDGILYTWSVNLDIVVLFYLIFFKYPRMLSQYFFFNRPVIFYITFR